MAGRAMRSVCRRPWVARAKKQATEKAVKEAIAAAKAEAEAEARQPHTLVFCPSVSLALGAADDDPILPRMRTARAPVARTLSWDWR